MSFCGSGYGTGGGCHRAQPGRRLTDRRPEVGRDRLGSLLKDASGNSSDIFLSDYRFNVGILDDVFTLNVDQPEGSAPASQ